MKKRIRVKWQGWRELFTIRTGFLVAALLIMAPLAAYNMQGWIRLLVFPGEANFGEGIIVAEAMRLGRGENIYGDPAKPPYWVVTYPPLFHLLSAPLAWAGMWWPRLVTIMSSCVLLWIYVLLGRRLTGTILTGLVAGALYVNSPCANAWSAIARTDTLGRMLESATIACALLIVNPRRALVGAIVCSSLAMLAKQNMIAGGIVAFWILWTRQRRLAFCFGVGWVGLTVALYGLIELITGNYFKHILGYTSRSVSLPIMFFWLRFFWHTHMLYIVAALPGLILAAMRRETWWLLVAVLAAVPHVVMAGNPGADRNYFLDLLWPICLLIPFGISELADFVRGRISKAFVQAALIALVAVLGWNTYRLWMGFRMPYPGEVERELTRRVTRNLEKTGGPVLSEVVGNALMAGYDVEVTPYIMKTVAESGGWDPKPIVEKLRRKEYKTVLLTKFAFTRYPPEVLQAAYLNYQVVKSFPRNYLVEEWVEYFIFRPKPDDLSTATVESANIDGATTATGAAAEAPL